MRGIALYADVAGSVALAERLVARHGAGGIDELSGALNSCFSVLVDVITGAGGEIVQFAGDALLAVWVVDEGVSLENAARSAAQAAVELGTLKARAPELARLGISLRTGVGAGDFMAARVGRTTGRWEIVVAGSAVDDAFNAMAAAPTGSSVLAPSAAVFAPGFAEGLAMDDGYFGLKSTAQHAVPFPEPQWLNEAPEPDLEQFVPEVIRLQAREGLDPWLAELRNLSVMFVKIHGLRLESGDDVLLLHRATCSIKEALGSNNGYFRQLSVDDKGIVIVAAFGLPPVQRERQPEDSLRAATQIRESLAAFGLRASIGIALGRVFCGAIGSPVRRDYTIIGNTVNLAARLMSSGPNDVLCDPPTALESESVAELEVLPAVQLKGLPDAIAPRRLLALRERSPAHSGRAAAVPGRESDAREILDLARNLGERENRTVVIEGVPGIGKSTLMSAIAEGARAAGMRVLVGGGTWNNQNTPYRAWAPVLEEALGITPEMDRARRDVVARAFLATDTAPSRTGPLLKDVLPLDLEDTVFTASLDGVDRAEEVRELIVRQLVRYRGSETLVLVMDDVQWADPASWSVILNGLPTVGRLLTVLGMRPLENASAEIGTMLQHTNTRRRVLQPLGEEAIGLAAASAAGTRELDPGVVRWLVNRSGGNPFFARQLALALVQRGLVKVANGRVVRSPTADELSTLALPASVEALVLHRLDLLDPVQQVVLKTASVIGSRYTEAELFAVHPLPEHRGRLREDLEALVSAQLAVPDADGFVFAHQIVLDVAYGTMVGAQRTTAHERVARHIEETGRMALTAEYARLAHHWGAANVDEPTFRYLELAATEVLRKGAFSEATSHLTRALALDDSRGNPMERARRARWHRQLGEAHEGIGNMGTSKDHMVKALALHGHRLPDSERGWSSLLVRSLILQLRHLVLPPRVLRAGSAERDRATEIICAAQTLSEVKHQENDGTGAAAAILLATNASDLLGAASGVARPYSFVGVIFAMMGRLALARRYWARARAIAQQVGDVSGEIRNDMAEAYVSHWMVGDFDHCETLLERGRILAAKHGLRREAEMVEASHASLNASRAIHGGAGRDRALKLLAISRERSRPLGEVWALLILSTEYLRTGELDAAAQCIAEVREHHDLLSQEQVMSDGRELSLHVRRESWAQVRAVSDRLADRLGVARDGRPGATRLAVFTMADSFFSYCESCVAILERSSSSGDGLPLDNATEAWKAHKRFSKRCLLTRPAALAFEGRVRCLAGETGRGLTCLRGAVHLARTLHVPFVMARALQYLAQSEPPGSAERTEHLAEARAVYAELGCAWDVRRVDELLSLEAP